MSDKLHWYAADDRPRPQPPMEAVRSAQDVPGGGERCTRWEDVLAGMSGSLLLLEVGRQIRTVLVRRGCGGADGLGTPGEAAPEPDELQSVLPDDYPMLETALRRCAAFGETIDLLYRVRSASWHRLCAMRLNMPGGARPRLLASVTDVSNLQHDALEHSLNCKKIEILLDLGRLMSFEVDIASHTVTISEAFLTAYGWPPEANACVPESTIGAGLIAPGSVPAFRDMYEQMYGGAFGGQTEVEIRSLPDDCCRWVTVSWRMVCDDHGVPVKAVGIFEEIPNADSSLDHIAAAQRQLVLQEKYYQRAQQYQQELRRFRHDRKNHLVILGGLLNNNDVEGAKRYLREMGDTLKNDIDLIHTGNATVDTLISEKLAVAKELGIRTEHTIGISPNVGIAPVDLGLAVGCCLDNAIEACRQMLPAERPDAAPFIRLQLTEQRGVVVFKMVNSSLGPQRRGDWRAFPTSKADVQNHGFGLRNVSGIVAKYGGYLDLEQKADGTFSTAFTLFVDMQCGEDAPTP